MGDVEMGARLKAVRKALKLTQKELEDKLRISRSQICFYEKGKKKITERTILSYASILGVNENWIKTGEGSMFSDFQAGSKQLVLKDEAYSRGMLDGIKLVMTALQGRGAASTAARKLQSILSDTGGAEHDV